MDSSEPTTSHPVLSLTPSKLSIFTLGLIVAALLTVGWIAQVWNLPFGIWFTEVGIFFGISWWAVRISGRDPLRYPKVAYGSTKTALFGFTLGVVNFFAVVIPIQFLAQQVAPPWMKDVFDGSRIFKGQGPVAIGIIVAGVGFAAPFCEEYFFRGVFQSGFGPKRWGLVLTAIVFSALHVDPVGFAARAELGLLFGVLFWRTGSLWPGVMAHSANNLVSTALFFAAGDAASGDSSVKSVVLVTALGGIGLFGLLAWARWFLPPFAPPLRVEGPQESDSPP